MLPRLPRCRLHLKGLLLPSCRRAADVVELKRPNVLYEDLKQKFGYIGMVNHKEVGVWDLFAILRGVRTKRDLGFALQTMNLFYNFGVKLKHREIATRLLAATMLAREESEAMELIKLYGTWLEHPPDTAVVYAVMSKFLDEKKLMEVRDLAKYVREDWRFRLEAPLYLSSDRLYYLYWRCKYLFNPQDGFFDLLFCLILVSRCWINPNLANSYQRSWVELELTDVDWAIPDVFYVHIYKITTRLLHFHAFLMDLRCQPTTTQRGT